MFEKIIINADDFGLTPGVNRGIIECHEAGTVTSTTMMAQGAAAPEAARSALRHPELGVGIHLNITSGRPVLPAAEVPSLVNSQGAFPGRARMALWLSTGRARNRHLEAEAGAQIERLRQMGIEPTHIDSHHHIHAHPRLRALLKKVGAAAGISKVRRYKAATFPRGRGSLFLAALEAASPGKTLAGPAGITGIDGMGKAGYAGLVGPLLTRGAGTLEVMCHPGYCDEMLKKVSRYNAGREEELRSLSSPELAEMLNRSGVRMVSYRDL